MRSVILIISILATLETCSQAIEFSELPIVIIETFGPEIQDDERIDAYMGVIWNEAGEMNSITDAHSHYSGGIAIETRGNSSQLFEKKSYGFETRNELNEDLSFPLLGMGADEDWILHSMHIDKTLMRIPLSHYLFQRMGHYAPNWKYVEVIINGEYRGLYLLMEKIKRDDDRLDIARLDADDLIGDAVTGGYILKIDWIDDDHGFYSNYDSQGEEPLFIQLEYPSQARIRPEQVNYISTYVDEFEEALFDLDFINSLGRRYSHYIDVESFIDFILINEFSKNSDAYKLSTYMHKHRDSDGGLLHAGPIWDFDQTYGNSVFCSGDDPSGWVYLQNQGCNILYNMPMWWQSLMGDNQFRDSLNCRYRQLRQTIFNRDSLFSWIDSNQEYIAQAGTRNFIKWDEVLGENIWAQPFPIPEDYIGELEYLKNWIDQRLTWMDIFMEGVCPYDKREPTAELEIFPNPTSGRTVVRAVEGSQLEVFTTEGERVFMLKMESDVEEFDISHLSSGFYIARSISDYTEISVKIVLLPD